KIIFATEGSGFALGVTGVTSGTEERPRDLSHVDSASLMTGDAQMTILPVLPLVDAVLLPGMVIPVTLDSETQAAVDAARSGYGDPSSRAAGQDRRVLAVPRIDGEYGSVGTIAVIDRVGRLPTGEPAAVVRGLVR